MRRFLKTLAAISIGFTFVVFATLLAAGDLRQATTDARALAFAGFRSIVPPLRVRRTRALNRANMEREVARAVNRRDYRLVGIGGIGLFYPGLDDRQEEVQRAVALFGYRFIDGTSDYAEDVEQAEFQHAAYQYARKYNLLLWPHLPLPSNRPARDAYPGASQAAPLRREPLVARDAKSKSAE